MKDSVFFQYIRKIRKSLLLFLFFVVLFGVVFFLWNLSAEAYLYALFLAVFLLLISAAVDFFFFLSFVRRMRRVKETSLATVNELPVPKDPEANAYRELLVRALLASQQNMKEESARKTELLDYYSMWVHQIKSPIAAMRLMLQSKQETNRRFLNAELFRVEQYVDMALQYTRLENMSSDLVLRETKILPVIRQSVRKFAPIFIEKHLSLELEETDLTVITDEKWIAVVIEQILSNALKYTSFGKIRIYPDPDNASGIVIMDTGIGIRPEDLPRVFERGFTGYNGRTDKRATGLGLYLAKKIMDRLSHKIRILSDGSTGTFVFLDFSQTPYKNES